MQSFYSFKYLYNRGHVQIWHHPQNDMDIKVLIERAKEKDAQALDTLYRMYFPKMLGLCIKIAKVDEDTAKDLVHDAFVLAFSSLHNLNNPERFGEWMTTIVRNVTLKYLERKDKIHFVPISEDDEDAADGNVSAESLLQQQEILNLVNQLPEGYGKIFRLYAIDGFSHQEIAEILGIEPHSSSSQLSRAKAMLRKMIGQKRWTVVLLMILAIPLYLFLSREKSLPQKLEVAERKSGKQKEIEKNNEENAEDGMDIVKTVHEKITAENMTVAKPDTLMINDTISVDINLPEEQITENRRDSIEIIDSIQPQFQLLDLPDFDIATEKTKKKPKKWQMLTAGSLGPALAQNIYRLMATDNTGDITDSPSIPENVSTWEDYSRYLNALKHDGMSKDSLALIEIANNNNGDIIEQEQHDRPITFGLSLSKQLSDRWSVETGLQYSILKSRSIIGNNEYHIRKNQNIHYLGIPLRMSYRFADYKRLSAYGAAGVSLNIPIYNKVNEKYIVANESQNPATRLSITPPAQWSTNLSLGLQYRVLPKLTLYVEPTLYWYIPNRSSTHTIWTEHPFTFSAPLGIRFTW